MCSLWFIEEWIFPIFIWHLSFLFLFIIVSISNMICCSFPLYRNSLYLILFLALVILLKFHRPFESWLCDLYYFLITTEPVDSPSPGLATDYNNWNIHQCRLSCNINKMQYFAGCFIIHICITTLSGNYCLKVSCLWAVINEFRGLFTHFRIFTFNLFAQDPRYVIKE